MIYIAGKYTSQARLREIRQRLRTAGYVVSSSWMDEVETDKSATPKKMVENAERDVTEVTTCNTFIIDTLDESATGGREVELGLALAADANIILVGPRRNVFHFLISDFYADWPRLLDVFMVDA